MKIFARQSTPYLCATSHLHRPWNSIHLNIINMQIYFSKPWCIISDKINVILMTTFHTSSHIHGLCALELLLWTSSWCFLTPQTQTLRLGLHISLTQSCWYTLTPHFAEKKVTEGERELFPDKVHNVRNINKGLISDESFKHFTSLCFFLTWMLRWI